MANTLGIPEVSMADLRDSTNNVNVIGAGAGSRQSAYEPSVVRVTNHEADDGGSADFAEGMALFNSQRHGEPWVLGKSVTSQSQIILQDGDSEDLSAGTIYPDYDYSTFE